MSVRMEMTQDACPSASTRAGGYVSEMQRRRLLAAMLEVLGLEGLDGVTVGKVCRHAGVSRRTFYDLFEDRQACFLAAFESALDRLAEQVDAAWRSDGHWHERVRRGLEVLLERFDEEPALARVCLVEALKGGPLVLERRRAVLAALAGAIDEGREESRATMPPPALAAESIVGGALGVIQARVLERDATALEFRANDLLNQLMSMIVHPYLGAAAARRELEQSTSGGAATRAVSEPPPADLGRDLFPKLPIRVTFRTARVLETIGSHPGASNRDVGRVAGVTDQGQASKLLRRLERAELIENRGRGQTRGEPNAWRLTSLGEAVTRVVGADSGS
jgi:AcrR family transcriptional regulator